MNTTVCGVRVARVLGLALLTLPFGSLLQGQSSFVLSSGSAPAGSPVSLALTLTSAGAQPAGIEWAFSYPASAVAAFSVTPGPVLTAAGKTLTCGSSSGNYVCMATGINSNLIANGVAANVSVTRAASAISVSVGVSGAMAAALDSSQITTTATGGTATGIVTSVLSN